MRLNQSPTQAAGGWLRAPKVPAAAGGGSQAAEEKGRRRRPRWSATRGKLSSPAQQGKVQHAPAPRSCGPRPPAPFRRRLGLRRPREGEGRAAGGARPVRGLRQLERRSCGRARVSGVPGGWRGRWVPRPFASVAGGGGPTRWRWFPGRGLRWGGGPGGTPGAACDRRRVRPAGVLGGSRQSRALTPSTARGDPEGGRWGGKRRRQGDGRDSGRGWAVLPRASGSLLAGVWEVPDRVGSNSSPKSQLGAHRLL